MEVKTFKQSNRYILLVLALLLSAISIMEYFINRQHAVNIFIYSNIASLICVLVGFIILKTEYVIENTKIVIKYFFFKKEIYYSDIKSILLKETLFSQLYIKIYLKENRLAKNIHPVLAKEFISILHGTIEKGEAEGTSIKL